MARSGFRLLTIYKHIYSSPVKQSRSFLNNTLQNQTNISFRNLSTSCVNRQIESLKQHVNGVDIHYEKTGKGGHPLLLLPGALGCARTDFVPQMEGLSQEKYTVIAFDPRGCGKSRPPDRDWPLDFLQRDAEDAAALMKALEYPRYSILGWSDGANTGMILAGANPGSVVSLVIWGGNSYVGEQDYDLYKKIESLDSWSPNMKKGFIDAYGEEYFAQMWAGWINVQKEIYTKRNGDICIGSLPNIKCSTLLVNGLKDALVPQYQPLFLQKHIVNCKMVTWPNGKHNLHLRYAAEFNALAQEFVDSEWATHHS